MSNTPLRKGMAGLPNKLDGRELTKPKNNTKNKKSNSSENYSNISSVKNSNYESNNKRSIHSTKDIFSPQLNNITRKNKNNNRKDSSYPFREQSRISDRIDSNNSSNFADISSSVHRNSSYNSSHKSINANNLELLSQSTSSRLISINSSSNVKIYDKSKYNGISSVSRGHSPISIDEINLRSIDKKNLNEKYLRSNLNNNNNYSQFDNQSYSNQYNNKVLSKSNNNYSINKCENCQKLNLQNDDAQSEIRKLKWDIDKLNNQYKSENEQLQFEIKYLKSNNENKKLEKQINNLESENKLLNTFKIENENLKLEINKNKSEKEKLRKEIDYLKLIKENFRVHYDNLENSNKQLLDKYENMKLQINKYESENENLRQTENENLKSKSIKNESKLKKSEVLKPLGFANPVDYRYLNSVVQVLGSCKEFKNDISNYKWISSEKTNDSIFVEGLFNLTRAIRECDRKNLDESLNIVQQNITESSLGNNVFECFMIILTRISNIMKTNTDSASKQLSNLPITSSEKAEIEFTKFKNGNPGFVFDHFYGQLTFQTICTLCKCVCNESFQVIKSLVLPVPNSKSSETLNNCIDMFFSESDVVVDEPMKCDCENQSTKSLKSKTKLTHGPKYFFMYLNRGSCTEADKNNTHVTCDHLTIDIKTLKEKSIKYKLISVIDHIGDSAGGHYYCKCSFESEEWWLLNDSHVDRLKNKNDIVTENTIVFLFKITP